MEIALVGIVGALVVAQFGALWTRIGRVEDKLDKHIAANGGVKYIAKSGGQK